MRLPAFFTALMGIACCASAELTPVFEQKGDYWDVRLVLSSHEVTVFETGQGLWGIGREIRNGWPNDVTYTYARDKTESGPWTILTGHLAWDAGTWQLRDAYRVCDDGRVELRRRWEWHGEENVSRVTLGVEFATPATGSGVVMPGVLYHGNPSGARSGRVPTYTGRMGERAVFEEHRFAMPFVSVEWAEGDARYGAALHTVPSPTPYGNVPDQWWSMGVQGWSRHTDLLVLSGPCAANGEKGVIKAVQPGFVPYNQAWLEVPPGAVIEKTVFLQAYPVERAGAGFQPAVQASLDHYPPHPVAGLPAVSELIDAKLRFAGTRWLERDGAAGWKKYPDRDTLVMGWCGQAAALGYALPVLLKGRDLPHAHGRAQNALDFLSTAAFYEGGFHTWYHVDTGKWDRHEPLSQGQAMANFANAIRVGREDAALDTSKWEDFLRRACAFHADRILDEDWRPNSTDEAFFVEPLCAGAALLNEPRFLEAAIKAGEHYVARHLDMSEPYWGGTLDASCEDKEGAFAALQAFFALHEATGDAKWLDYAQHAGDVTMSYTVVWSIDMPPGRLRNHAFDTRGWTVVSPQNQHIDVFGVLIAPYIYRLAERTGNARLRDWALLMYRTCGQLLDPYGSQGEQPQHTNYAQRGAVDDVFALRGGYVEDWTVFWITAHFLNAAAQFTELGATGFAE